MVWSIASGEATETLEDFRDALGLSIPILDDRDRSVFDAYETIQAFPSGAYPQQFLVGADGTVLYYGNTFEYDTLVDLIDDELERIAEE